MKEIPPIVWVALSGFVGGLLLPFVASWARRAARTLRGDKDPKNDWQADVLDAVADSVGRGDRDAAKTILSKMVKPK